MITYIEFGNIFKIEEVTNYAHGCNCAGSMGKGIALQFRQKFPEMYTQYKQLCKDKVFKPGDVFAYTYQNGYVYNLGTQATWRTKATLTAIENSMYKMLDSATEKEVKNIALPRIGAGLGGLDWEKVKERIEKVSQIFPDVHLWVVENYQA